MGLQRKGSSHMAYKIAIIVGSLRKDSLNRKVARSICAIRNDNLDCSMIEIGDLPLYNQDLDGSPPEQWVRFREQIGSADGVLFVSPEYNRGIPGVLKNAIDVASRPYGKSSFLGKPVGIVSNSPGPLGGVSAAKHLQNILPGISGPILGQPEIYLNGVGDAFDERGELIKESLGKILKQYIDAFAAHVEKHNK